MESVARAPMQNVLLSDGRRVPLESFYRDRPLAMVFLRHLGCIFCSEHVGRLAPHTDLNLVFVSLETPDRTEAFRADRGARQPFICDPGEDLYQAFGLENARIAQMANVQTIGRGMAATFEGHRARRPLANPRRLGGAFVLDREGAVRWSRPARHAADNVGPEEVRAALAAACEEA